MIGATLTVEGVVTWDVDFDDRIWFFQDATGGFTVFFSAGDATIVQGDRVRVTGDISEFRSEVQVSPVTTVERVGTEAVPFPRGVTAAEVNAGNFQGELVTIAGTVDSLQVQSFDNHLVFLTDGNGDVFTAYGDSRTGQGSADWTIAATVQVTGVLGNDDRNTPQQRVEIRSPADVR
jgi:DNA/RNA endonuclease YhcR with UshA esterase domain